MHPMEYWLRLGDGEMLAHARSPTKEPFGTWFAVMVLVMIRDLLRKWYPDSRAVGVTEPVTIFCDTKSVKTKALLDTGCMGMTCITEGVYKKIGSPPYGADTTIITVSGTVIHKTTYVKYMIKDATFEARVSITNNNVGYDLPKPH